ncbi:hypothetical protein PGH46_16830 [Legionella pneumophila]|nr:hypothetical protein PGH46_16830 [Legionella pneumophila]
MAGSGIQTLINSTLELLERYEALGNVKVRIVTFNTSATAIGSVWMTVDAAKNALLGLTAGGNTNFDAALITAMNAFNSGTVDGADGRIGEHKMCRILSLMVIQQLIKIGQVFQVH